MAIVRNTSQSPWYGIHGKNVRSCGSFFLDSGAHTLYTYYVRGKDKKDPDTYTYYRTRCFREYLDSYAEFIKTHGKGIDFYVNVDAIYNPELSWWALKYLENEHGLSPVPVIHSRTPLKWLDKHLEAGYTFIGVGGLGQESTRANYVNWADAFYDRICWKPDRLPQIRTHGFAMTSYALMIRYPWWSVDSASWAKAAAFGMVFVPHKRNGKFVFDVPPYVIGFSHHSAMKEGKGRHFYNYLPAEQKVMKEWFKSIGCPMGRMDGNHIAVEGVLSHYGWRAIANLKFFERLCQELPEWPWPFRLKPRRGFFQ